jgi:5-methylcytosine-specific restriction endonuclease McrBC GTP-binding regulatory subunit McrB
MNSQEDILTQRIQKIKDWCNKNGFSYIPDTKGNWNVFTIKGKNKEGLLLSIKQGSDSRGEMYAYIADHRFPGDLKQRDIFVDGLIKNNLFNKDIKITQNKDARNLEKKLQDLTDDQFDEFLNNIGRVYNEKTYSDEDSPITLRPSEENMQKKTKRGKLLPENLYDYFEQKDFSFPKEILTRYFLSLKTKPFVILTGISGTGKTKIAQIFADYMCQDLLPEEKKKRVAFVPVRPDWMDNKGLIGYYNLLDEKYYATPVLRLLIEAGQHPEQPYFVIFDEMNLAKVEQYFSDFLSIMESRTPDKTEGEPITLHTLTNITTTDGLDIPQELYIPPNVYFSGTVNIDESTYMFSPKVLDRANVIEFNEVNLADYEKEISAADKFILNNAKVRDNLLSKDEPPFCSRQDYRKLLEITGSSNHPLSSLLDILKEYNHHFGYRVINEISRFVRTANDMIHKLNMNDAMDIQFLQKVLPKFHGTQAKLAEPLEGVLSFCYGQDAPVDKATRERARYFDEKARFPRTAQKTARMLINLEIQGYTSFIE